MVLIMGIGPRVARVAGAAVAVVLGLGACAHTSTSSADNGRVDVVAAFYPLAEAARQVGGPDVHVQDLTPAGAEPHDLEVTTRQVDALEDADLVVAMGHGFQPAVEDVAKKRKAGTVFVLDDLPIDAGDRKVSGEGRNKGLDPHVWLDPALMKDIVQVVEEQLADADPDHGATYSANAARYVARLDALDEEYRQGLARCRRNEIVTAHEAFGWLAKRYGLDQHAIAGIAPDQEPSANRIAELADLAKRDGVTTIFTETLVSPKVAQTLAREAGGLQTKTLNPLEGLSNSDRERGADYVSVMQGNLRTLRAALGCT